MNKSVILMHSGGINSSYLLHALTRKDSDLRDARFIIVHIDESKGKIINYIRKQVNLLKLKNPRLNISIIAYPNIVNGKIDFKSEGNMKIIANILEDNISNWITIDNDNINYIYFGSDESTILFNDLTNNMPILSNIKLVYPIGLKYGQSLYTLIKLATEFATCTTECKHSEFQWCGKCDECKKYKDTLFKFAKSPEISEEDIFKINKLNTVYDNSTNIEE